jgi:hypothetical protein
VYVHVHVHEYVDGMRGSPGTGPIRGCLDRRCRPRNIPCRQGPGGLAPLNRTGRPGAGAFPVKQESRTCISGKRAVAAIPLARPFQS